MRNNIQFSFDVLSLTLSQSRRALYFNNISTLCFKAPGHSQFFQQAGNPFQRSDQASSSYQNERQPQNYRFCAQILRERHLKFNYNRALTVFYGQNHKCSLNILKERWENHFYLNKSRNTNLMRKLWMKKSFLGRGIERLPGVWACENPLCFWICLNDLNGIYWNEVFDEWYHSREWNSFWQSGLTRRDTVSINCWGALGKLSKTHAASAPVKCIGRRLTFSALTSSMRSLLPEVTLRMFRKRVICPVSEKIC